MDVTRGEMRMSRAKMKQFSRYFPPDSEGRQLENCWPYVLKYFLASGLLISGSRMGNSAALRLGSSNLGPNGKSQTNGAL